MKLFNDLELAPAAGSHAIEIRNNGTPRTVILGIAASIGLSIVSLPSASGQSETPEAKKKSSSGIPLKHSSVSANGLSKATKAEALKPKSSNAGSAIKQEAKKSIFLGNDDCNAGDKKDANHPDIKTGVLNKALGIVTTKNAQDRTKTTGKVEILQPKPYPMLVKPCTVDIEDLVKAKPVSPPLPSSKKE